MQALQIAKTSVVYTAAAAVTVVQVLPTPVTVGLVCAAAAPLALSAVGFGTAGVVGGSLAAAVQSGIGNVAAGSLFATCQSAGAAGLAMTTKLAVGVGGGAVTKGVGWIRSKL